MTKRPILFSTSGTAGDVRPFIALAGALKRRGHPVTLLSSEDHRGLAAASGIDFTSVQEPDWPQDGRDDGRFWREVVVPAYPAIVGHIESRFASGERPIVVARDGNWAIRFWSEKHATPFVRIVLQPCALVEQRNPVPPHVTEILNAVRSGIGLPPAACFHDNDDHWQPTISFFPDWYGVPQSGMAQAGLCAGFPFLDGIGGTVAPELQSFLQRHGDFVLFSAGTGVRDATRLRDAALGFCRETGLATVFLGRDAGPLPEGAPEQFAALPFADHGALLRRCLLAVHNGGIGTTARCLRAGVPQIVVPLRYDQPDNARRIEALGLGIQLSADDLAGTAIAVAYRTLTGDSALWQRLDETARAVAATDAAEAAAERVEQLAENGALA